ncbi:MAG: zinc-ribbon domain-containing protein [Selenomonadaceae bacterium]|nr:zinc-ribbon domain-containing protein [Selenomonadaceae bacterium]
MICEKCGADIPENMIFCGQCGAKIERNPIICKHCGAKIPDDMKFCGQCGTKINESINDFPPEETKNTQDSPLAQVDSITPMSPVNSENEGIAKHEKATCAPIFSLIGLFSTKGRRSKKTAFLLGLFLMVLFWGILFFIFPLIFKLPNKVSGIVKFLSLIIMCTPFLLVYIGATNLIKRLHDTNRSGYWIILWILPILLSSIAGPMNNQTHGYSLLPLFCSLGHLIVALFITTEAGTIGSNRFGHSVEELTSFPQ